MDLTPLELWSPLELFWWSVLFSSLAAIGSLLRSGKQVSLRMIVGTVLLHGPVGGGLGLGAYAFLAWKSWIAEFKTLVAFAAAIAYGAGIVRAVDIRGAILRAIGKPGGTPEDA